MSLENLVEINRKTHPSGSDLHNTVKCIFLNFTTATTDLGTGTFITTAYGTVNIAHPVKEIIIKQIGWNDNGSNTPSGVTDIGIMFSDLVNGGCIGSFNANNSNVAGNTYVPHYTAYQNVRHVYKVPRNIQGSYQFTILDTSGAPFPDTNGTRTQARAFVIAEFISYSGKVEDVST